MSLGLLGALENASKVLSSIQWIFMYRVTKCFSDIFLHIISTLFKFQPLLSYIKDLYSLDLNVFLESDHMDP